MLSNRNIGWILAIIIAVYCCAIGVDTMDEDASQYASLSFEMKHSGHYLQVFQQGLDYLDKPPLLFWSNCLSMQFWGETNFAIKFPSILFAILAIYATYRLARLYYALSIAQLAALVLATSQALFLMTNDIRTDTILMGWVITAIWQLAEWTQSNKPRHFFLACVATGGGLLTKGPIAVFVPVVAFGSHWLLQRNFRYFFKPIYLSGIVIIAVILTPMCLGLYQQFDQHPEKIINPASHGSGLRFFFWTQSFGRITGESGWSNPAKFGFLFENLLWEMLPWTAFFVAGFAADWVAIIRKKFRLAPHEEFITTGGFAVTYCALASSKYQLPHYIYVVLPLLAISTAKILHALFWQGQFRWVKRLLLPVQGMVCAIGFAAPIVILLYAFPAAVIWPWLIPLATFSIAVFILTSKSITHKWLRLSIALTIGFNLFLSLWFFPKLLEFQPGNVVGRYISENQIPPDQFYLYRFSGAAKNIHFYSHRIVQSIDSLPRVGRDTYLLTTPAGLTDIQSSQRKYAIILRGQNFHVSTLTREFLNIQTRDRVVSTFVLVKLTS